MVELAPARARVAWGRPLRELLVEQVAREGSRACFVMVSRTLRRQSEEVRGALAALGATCCAVYEGVRPHTPRADVLAAAEAARAAGADLVVTIGGGSLTDAGKAVCLLLEHPEVKTLADFDAYRNRGSFVSPPHYEHRGLVRQVAVPTTLSGGEFTAISGVTNEAIPRKESFVHPMLQPVAVIFDPAVAIHTPQWLWLSTGVRAVDHCVEGLCSVSAHHYSDAQAAAGLRLLVPALSAAARDPADADARLRCQLGCMLAASLVQMGIHFGASHALGHALGGTAGVPHGHTSCVLLPAVVAYNAGAIADKLPLLAELFGRPDGHVAGAIANFIKGLGMPRSLSEVNVPESLLPKIARIGMRDPWLKTNPRGIADESEALSILRAVFLPASRL